jgi:hypothetical protein
MISFNTPCFKFKLLAAVKYQYGFPGFAPPYSTRYLSLLITETRGITAGPGAGGFSTTASQLFTIDRINGGPTPGFLQGATGYFVFPYGQDLTADPNTTYTVTDDANVSWTTLGAPAGNGLGNQFTTVTLALSNPYTLAQLDADADALLATIDPSTMPWGMMQEAFYDIFGPPDAGIPAQYGYGGATGGDVAKLNAAAWSFLTLGLVSTANYYPNAYSKLISYIAMAGNYCQKTLYFDYNNNLINQTCLNGVGACGSTFEVTPPPLSDGQNTVVIIVPNCQCG